MDSFNYSLQRKAFHSFLLSNRDLIKVAIDSSQSMIGFVIASFSVPQRAKINALFVLPSYQRNGVGSLLLNALYDELRSYPKLVYLSVRIPVVYGKSKLFFLSNQFKTITRIISNSGQSQPSQWTNEYARSTATCFDKGQLPAIAR